MKRKQLYLILVWTLWGFLCVVPATTRAAGPPLLVGAISVQQNTATPDFPKTIKFSLNAKLTIAPTSLKSVTLNYNLLGNVATSVRVADLTNGSNTLQAQASLDTQRNYIPPGTHVSYYWEFTATNGEIYDTSSQELVYQDQRFAFQEAKNALVTVRWYAGTDAFGKAALNKAQATIDRLSREYNIKPSKTINITIYPDSETMFTALPPNTAEWVGGQAIPTLGTIVLAIRPGDLTEVNRSIPHEVTHQVNYQATKNPYNRLPLWLDEGLAVYNQDQVDGFLTQAFQRGIERQNLIPLRVLDGTFPADTQESYLAYGESVNVIKYIIGKYGNGAIERILDSFKNGVSYDEAVRAGLGISLDELDHQWKQSLGYNEPNLNNGTPIAATTTAGSRLVATETPAPPTPSVAPTLPVSPSAGLNSAPDLTATFASDAVTQAVAQLTGGVQKNATVTPQAVKVPSVVASQISSTDNSTLIALGLGIVALLLGGLGLALVFSKRTR